jgi:glucoamylase
VGDSGPSAADRRTIVDTSFLELVRLGVRPAGDANIVRSLGVVDEQLGVQTPSGQFWHRNDFDGYGENPDGTQWDIGFPHAASAPAPNNRRR